MANGKKHNSPGFTIVELLIVIVVIGILAAITVIAYNGMQDRAKTARRDNDISLLRKAILAARVNSGLTTVEVTGTGMTSLNCERTPGNASLAEPRTLNYDTSACWVNWRQSLDKLSAASGMNLSGLYKGDSNGNPYYLNENEGENNSGNYCLPDYLGYFTGNGMATVTKASITATNGSSCAS